jgi:hypothetical protein
VNTFLVIRPKPSGWNARIVATALSLIAFPILVAVGFYASQKLVPSLAKFQFSLPTQQTSVATTEITIGRPDLNGSIPKVLNLSLPNFSFVTYSDILIAISAIVVVLVCIQGYRVITNRRTTRPVSDIDEVIEERERVATILDEAVRKLNLGSNYRDTVLKCYKLITQTLEAKSSLDGRALTAGEFRDIIYRKLKFDSVHLARVTSLFEVARYSENEITEDNATEAIECLSSLSTELRAGDLIPTR